uniref:Methyltransferase 22, Kin17 lysine n=1 Tax=Cyprinodon variegatus TaxID=28743 RepID=A0A3Q2CF73_CYPVA
MDQITFQHDTVLSDVHMHRPNTRHLMTRLSAVGQPGVSAPPPIRRSETLLPDAAAMLASHDVRQAPRKDSVDDGGRDLVCPVILQQSDPEQHDEDDEDDGDDEDAHFSKDIIRIDVVLWSTIISSGFLPLCCLDADGEFSWTEEEVADLYDNASFILAADVCYDDDLTDGLFRTLYRLCSSFRHAAAIFISLEKRMNFSLRHMDVCCEAYNHFMHCLSQLQDLQDGRWRFMVELVPLNFPQFLLYERIEQLVREVLLKRFNSVSVPDKAGDGDL